MSLLDGIRKAGRLEDVVRVVASQSDDVQEGMRARLEKRLAHSRVASTHLQFIRQRLESAAQIMRQSSLSSIRVYSGYLPERL